MKNKFTPVHGFISIEIIIVAGIMLAIGYASITNFRTITTGTMTNKIANLSTYLNSADIIIIDPTEPTDPETNPGGSGGHVISLDDGFTVSSTGILRGSYTGDSLSIIIPEKIGYDIIREIEADAFNRDYLISIEFDVNSAITHIHARAFADNLLEDIQFPASLTTISLLSFKDNNLKKLILPESLTVIEQNAFMHNEITEITVGTKLTTIKTGAFGTYHDGFPEAYRAGGAGTYSYTDGKWIKQ